MNVNVAGYLQLANALLGLAMGIAVIALGSDADGYRVSLGLFAFAILTGVVGVGLLRRRAWARWLMLGPGFIGPLTAVVGLGIAGFGAFMGGLVLDSTRVRIFGWSAANASIVLWVMLLGVSMIVSGLVNFRLFGYLLGERGRDEFDSQEKGPIGATLLSLAVAALAVFIALTGTVRIPREHVPEAAQSKDMRDAISSREAEILEALPAAAVKAVFSADSRRLVIPPPTDLLDLVVVDLESGVARRPKLNSAALFRDAAQFRRMLAPDASSFVMGNQWVSLESGAATDVQDLLPANTEPLGFYAPTRLLIRNRQADTLQLVDLKARRVLYSMPANLGQYDFPGMQQANRNGPPAGWSPMRDRFAWIGLDGGVSTLNLDSGEVQSIPCGACLPDRQLRMADDGGREMLVIADQPGMSHEFAQLVREQGQLIQVPGINGELGYFSTAENEIRALIFDSGRRVLVMREVVSGANWEARLGDGVSLWAAAASGDLVIRESGRGGPDRYWLAHLDPPPANTQLVLQEVRPASGETMFKTISPDGRYALFATLDGKLEIVDLRSLRDGAFNSRTLDFRAGTQLERTRTVSSTERRTLAWTPPRMVDEPGTPSTYDPLHSVL